MGDRFGVVLQPQVPVAVDGSQVRGDQPGQLLGAVDVVGALGEASSQQAGELFGYVGENVVLGQQPGRLVDDRGG
ncbi:hypothetical protein [Kitasatospora sp. NPDC057738]|uniref:hypothetical protein n=1 Tax=Kitasatospora sp. NPDC057738 TaxID=3346233 RepID=UPI003692B967